MVHRFLRIERRAKGEPPRPSRRPIPVVPAQDEAEAVLAALAGRIEPGAELSLAAIVAAAGCSEHVAARSRAYLRSRDRWPYLNAVPERKAVSP